MTDAQAQQLAEIHHYVGAIWSYIQDAHNANVHAHQGIVASFDVMVASFATVYALLEGLQTQIAEIGAE